MPRYITRQPKIIVAEQWDGNFDPTKLPKGAHYDPHQNAVYVVTIHDQSVYLQAGDWIVEEPDKIHHYPIKDEIFTATYTLLDDEPSGERMGERVG